MFYTNNARIRLYKVVPRVAMKCTHRWYMVFEDGKVLGIPQPAFALDKLTPLAYFKDDNNPTQEELNRFARDRPDLYKQYLLIEGDEYANSC